MNAFRKIIASAALSIAAVLAHAGALTDYAEGVILGHVFQGSAYTAPGTLYVALYTTPCSDASAGVEVAGGSYARVAITSSGANWTGPTAGNGTISNTNAATFPAPTGDWGAGGQVTGWAIVDAATAGNQIVCAALTTAKSINNGDPAPSFAASALQFQLDN